MNVDARALRTSSLLKRIRISPTFHLESRAAALRAKGEDVIMLGAGEPDFPTPAFIIDAADAAARAGQTRYTPMRGTLALRNAIRRRLERDHGLTYEADQVIACTGAKQALFNVMHAVLDPGDEVLLPAPCWVSYGDMAAMAGGVPRYAPTQSRHGFVLQPDDLENAITARTRMIVFNSPNNPSGAAYDLEDWRKLGKVLEKHPDILVVSDDIYEKIMIADQPCSHFLEACPEFYERTLIVNGVSKTYAMTGWRLGYAAGPRNIVAAMELVQSQATSGPSSLSQAAAEAALDADDAVLRPMLDAFRARHDKLLRELSMLPGVTCLPAKGAFYLFPDITEAAAALARKGILAEASDLAMVEWLLQEHRLGLVPGSFFMGPGFLRLSFAASQQILTAASQRLARALDVLR